MQNVGIIDICLGLGCFMGKHILLLGSQGRLSPQFMRITMF